MTATRCQKWGKKKMAATHRGNKCFTLHVLSYTRTFHFRFQADKPQVDGRTAFVAIHTRTRYIHTIERISLPVATFVGGHRHPCQSGDKHPFREVPKTSPMRPATTAEARHQGCSPSEKKGSMVGTCIPSRHAPIAHNFFLHYDSSSIKRGTSCFRRSGRAQASTDRARQCFNNFLIISP